MSDAPPPLPRNGPPEALLLAAGLAASALGGAAAAPCVLRALDSGGTVAVAAASGGVVGCIGAIVPRFSCTAAAAVCAAVMAVAAWGQGRLQEHWLLFQPAVLTWPPSSLLHAMGLAAALFFAACLGTHAAITLLRRLRRAPALTSTPRR